MNRKSCFVILCLFMAQFNLRLSDSKRMRARVATAEPSERCRTHKMGNNGIRTGVNPVATIADFFMILKLRGLGSTATIIP